MLILKEKLLINSPTMEPENTELIVSPIHTIRQMARMLREHGIDYRIERVDFKNYNSSWKGYRGIGLRVTNEDYSQLFKKTSSHGRNNRS